MLTKEFRPHCIQRLLPSLERLAPGVPSLRPYYEGKLADPSKSAALRAHYDASVRALNSLLRLDYMGASEFEWGAFGNALAQTVHLREHLVPVTVQVVSSGHQVELVGWAQSAHAEPLQKFVVAEAAGRNKTPLKESTYLRRACFEHDPHCDIVGWLDIDLYWFLTKDPRLAEDVCRILGLDMH